MFAVAGHVIGVVMTSSPGPIFAASSAKWSAAVPERPASRVLRADVLGEAPLELSGARTGGDPAGLERLDDRLDLLAGRSPEAGIPTGFRGARGCWSAP